MDYDKLKKGTWKSSIPGRLTYDTISIDKVIDMYGHADMVNNPAHYTRGNTEVIDM